MLARYKEAVEKGVKLLDTHFEEVQLPPSSDSDEEDFSSGCVFIIRNFFVEEIQCCKEFLFCSGTGL